VNTCTTEQYRQYLETFTVPIIENTRFIQDADVGLVMLDEAQFRYSRTVGYAFEVAAMEEKDTGRRLLFIRIDSWDPEYRKNAGPGEIDYCIPAGYEGATAREKLSWTVPFGGAWSDTKEEATLVFDDRWKSWFARIKTGIAFTNPSAGSAAFLRFGEREQKSIDEFCKK
jgi:hypothetical protein